MSGVVQAAKLDANDDVDAKAFSPLEHSTILEESEEEATTLPSINRPELDDYVEDHFASMEPVRPHLHRANSYESILSNRGNGIPKLRKKGSQFLSGQGFAPRTSLGIATVSVGPVTVGRPSDCRQGYDSSNYNRILLGNSPTSTTSSDFATAGKSTLGKRVGGWMLGKWGVQPQPTASCGNLRAKDLLSTFDGRAKDRKNIDGRLSTHVEPAVLDNSLLQESLEERFKGRSFGV